LYRNLNFTQRFLIAFRNRWDAREIINHLRLANW
jgi:hypothetical protein